MKRATTYAVFAALLGSAVACDDTGASGDGGIDKDGSAKDGGAGAGVDAVSSDPGGDSSMSPGDSTSGGNDTGTDSGVASDAGVGLGCDPGGGTGGACARCAQEKCADLLAICERNADCMCMAECLGRDGVGGIAACLAARGLLARPPGFGALEQCVGVACPDGDECSTPAAWTPPAKVACGGSTAGLGGGSLGDCGFDPGLRFDPLGPILQLQSADQNVCARIVRRNDGPGTLANTSWTLLEIQVGPLGQVARVSRAADLCWYSSHHNFVDWIHTWAGTRHFDLVLEQYGHGGGRTYGLYVFEQGPINSGSCAADADGAMCIAGPIELFPVN